MKFCLIIANNETENVTKTVINHEKTPAEQLIFLVSLKKNEVVYFFLIRKL